MALIWFSDEDRQRMRAERAEALEQMERELLYLDFLRAEHPETEGTRYGGTQEFMDKIGRLDIRPWSDQPDEA